MSGDFSAEGALTLAAADVARSYEAAKEALRELEGEEDPGKDGRWAKRYHRRLGREIDAQLRLVVQIKMAAGFGEMDPTAVRDVLSGANDVIDLLRKACALADAWEKRTPVMVIEKVPLEPSMMASVTEELRIMCLDNVGVMERLERVQRGEDEMSVILLDEIEEGQEDGLEVAECMMRQARVWRDKNDVDLALLQRFERGVAVFADGCRLLMKMVEDTRPYSAEAVLALLAEFNEEVLNGGPKPRH